MRKAHKACKLHLACNYIIDLAIAGQTNAAER